MKFMYLQSRLRDEFDDFTEESNESPDTLAKENFHDRD